MSAFLDPKIFEIRGGPDCRKWKDDYTSVGTAIVQRDRSIYFGLACTHGGEQRPEDYLSAIEEAKKLGQVYGWTEIIWDRVHRGGRITTIRIPIIRPRG